MRVEISNLDLLRGLTEIVESFTRDNFVEMVND